MGQMVLEREKVRKSDNEERKRINGLEKTNEHLLSLIMEPYLGIVELDLQKEQVTVLKHLPNSEKGFCSGSWGAWLEHLCETILYSQDRGVFLNNFSMETLRRAYAFGKNDMTAEVRYTLDRFDYKWAEVKVLDLLGSGEQSSRIHIVLHDISERRFLKSLVDIYVYKEWDYCIYLDAKCNSYLMFSNNDDGTPMPPSRCSNYAAEVVEYTQNFVTERDQKKVIREMQIDRVQEILEKYGSHSFTYGVEDSIHGYRRKQLKYIYYDQVQQKILLTRKDITNIYIEEKRQGEQIRKAIHKAQTDELTGLYNRAVKQMIIERMQGDDLAAILFIDIDNFKSVNDTFGHAVGDEMLQGVASILKTYIRTMDLSGRIGGDEFIVYLSQIDSNAVALQCAKRLRNSIKAFFAERLPLLDVSCSIGIALYPQDGDTGDLLFERADQMAYQAKWNGKNQVVMCSDLSV